MTEPAPMDAKDLKESLGPLLFDHSPCFLAVVDAAYQLLLVNPAFEARFGRPDGRPCYAVYKAQDQPCEACLLQKTLGDGQPRAAEQTGLDKDGREVAFCARTVALGPGPDGGGRALHVALDTSRLRELEQGLHQAERLANVGLTAAGLAHTIKNILAGLEGGTYVVSSGLEKKDVERVQGGWAMVEKYIEQMGSLVKNLLSYARAPAPRREPVHPGELVRQVVELYQKKAEQAGITLEAQVADDLQPLEMERESLHAALTNLVSNAVDACTWDPDADKAHRIVIAAKGTEGGGVSFRVEDNGMGISAANQPKVLAAHFTTKGIRGTGLGLLLTKQTAESHGGEVGFSSTPGQGTAFTITLPGTLAQSGRAPTEGA